MKTFVSHAKEHQIMSGFHRIKPLGILLNIAINSIKKNSRRTLNTAKSTSVQVKPAKSLNVAK